MKKNVSKTDKKLSLEKFRVVELSNLKIINGGEGSTEIKTIPTKDILKNL